jgi:hypothetical protein
MAMALPLHGSIGTSAINRPCGVAIVALRLSAYR